MPYATMLYSKDTDDETIPTIAARIPLRGDPIADQKTRVKCEGKEYHVQRELQMTFDESDFTWIAFFSRPVVLRCISGGTGDAKVAIQFTADNEESIEESPLVARIALMTNCTTGNNPRFCQEGKPHNSTSYAKVLRKHADVYPGSNTNIYYDIDDANDAAVVSLDWDAQSMSGEQDVSQLITYAIPHQRDRLGEKSSEHCTPVLLGHACIAHGAVWNLKEVLPRVSFLAPRPPLPEAIPSLSKALHTDLGYKFPKYYMKGVGDTYFSGKMLGKAARILFIADEVKSLCNEPSELWSSDDRDAYKSACANATIPTDDETQAILELLRDATEIWINGSAQAPFVYDEGWGGVINCGCDFNGKKNRCDNAYPHCPSIEDPGLNFGNGTFD